MRISNMEVILNTDTFAPEMHVTLAFPMEILGSDEDGTPSYNEKPVIRVYEEDWENFARNFREQLMLYKDKNND